MSTNVDTWVGAADLGVIYPFPGIEWLLVIVAVLLWLGWHAWQVASENAEYRRALDNYSKKGLDKALDHTGSYDAFVVDGAG